MGHKSQKRRSRLTVKACKKQAVGQAKPKLSAVEIAKFERYRNLSEDEIAERKLKGDYMMTMTYQLAQVINDFLEIATSAYEEVGRELKQDQKRTFNQFFDLVQKLKACTSALVWPATQYSTVGTASFYRDCDYLSELIPLFLDKTGESSRTDYVAQCILQNIHERYTSKNGFFERFGLKHLTRTKREAERIRNINRWKKNQQKIKAAVIAGHTPPAEIPFPYPELDKQIYID